MLTVCWSPKGGSGTSVVAAALALQAASSGRPSLLIDLAGDQPSVLGLAPVSGQGVSDWLAASDDVPADSLRSLEVPVADGLRLLALGTSPPDAVRVSRLELAGAMFHASPVSVVVDAGSRSGIVRWWPASSTTVAVIRCCYLGVRRLREEVSDDDRLVLIEEPGRALTRRDVAAAVGEVAVALPWDPSVARAVDAGLLAHRMPRSLQRLRPLVAFAGVGGAR